MNKRIQKFEINQDSQGLLQVAVHRAQWVKTKRQGWNVRRTVQFYEGTRHVIRALRLSPGCYTYTNTRIHFPTEPYPED